jgi:hypothetical protein
VESNDKLELLTEETLWEMISPPILSGSWSYPVGCNGGTGRTGIEPGGPV